MTHMDWMPDYEALTTRINLIVLLGKLGVFKRLGIHGVADTTWDKDDVIVYGSDA